jgi:hypothetical protein
MNGNDFQNERESTDGGLKRLAVEDSIASAFRDIHNEFISWENLENLLVTVLPDHIKVRFWLGEFSKWKFNGNKTKLPREFPQFNELRCEILTGLNERVNNCDPLTKIACINYADRLWRSFDDVNPKIFLKQFIEHNGRMAQISGNPGTGKTDLGMLLTGFALQEGFVVITNIKSSQATLIRMGELLVPKNSIPNFYRTVRMSDFLYQCIQHRKAGRNVITVWDEVSTFYNRQEAIYKKNIDMGKFIRLIRKFNCNVFFIEQVDQQLSSLVNEMLVCKFQKETRKRLHFMTIAGDKQYNEYLDWVPKATMEFDTGDFAGFVNDIDFSDLFNKIAVEETEKLDEIEQYLMKIIDNNKLRKIRIKACKKIFPKGHGPDGKFLPNKAVSNSITTKNTTPPPPDGHDNATVSIIRTKPKRRGRPPKNSKKEST